jgi:hypothetical protein
MRPVGAELSCENGRTDGQTEMTKLFTSRLSEFCKRA